MTSQYKKGDHVVYPAHGVGTILGVEEQEIAGHSLELIKIQFSEDRMTLSVPMFKAKKIGLRPISDTKTIDKALTILSEKAKSNKEIWARRAQKYEEKINSGNPLIVAEVVRDLYKKVNQPEQNFSERKIYEQAFTRLVNEVAVCQKADKRQAAETLNTSLSQQP